LINSELVKFFAATLTKTEKLHKDLSALLSVQPNCTSKEVINKRTLFCFKAASGNLCEDTYVLLLLATLICHKSTVVHTQYFYTAGSGPVAQQHTQNALLCFHSNNGYANKPQCNVTWTLPILVHLRPVWPFLWLFNGLADTGQTWQKFRMTKISHIFVFYKSLSLIMPTWRLCKLSWRDQHHRSLV